ncbi:MAG TPA: RNA polymerase sigma factor [Polyangia bacterium]|jgi:RNA polymerase sigma-70 factor (ECF subfamily)|nr:RNA polymerase sigma factor [Polyangia bacterium]
MNSEEAQAAGSATASGALASLHPPDDLLGVARAAGRGDSDAAATLVSELGGGMLRVVRKVMGHQHPDVDDVTQDAVLALLGSLETFRGACSVEYFARRIALLTALGARRRAKVRQREAEAEGGAIDEFPGDELSPLATTVASRRRVLVRRLLDDLPEVIAEALALHFILDHTVEEIAEAAAVPANTVWSRLRLGKLALRRKLEQDAPLAEMLRGTSR